MNSKKTETHFQGLLEKSIEHLPTEKRNDLLGQLNDTIKSYTFRAYSDK